MILVRYHNTTARETAGILEMIFRRQLVSPRASETMLRVLKDQQSDDLIPWHLAEILPEHTVAHKTGGLPGVVHDAAVIDVPVKPFILCFFGSEVDVAAFGRFMGEMSLRVYKMESR